MALDDSRPPTPQRPAEQSRRRIPYRSPRLVRLGTLAEITLSVTDVNMRSDSGGPHVKT